MTRARILPALAASLVPLSLATAGVPAFDYTDLGTLGGPEARAFGLNDARQVVGWSNVSDTVDCPLESRPCRHAFVWESGVMTNLGILDGDEESVARAINNAGLAVGTSERDVIAGSGTFHGFAWSSGAMSARRMMAWGSDSEPALTVTDSAISRSDGLLISTSPVRDSSV